MVYSLRFMTKISVLIDKGQICPLDHTIHLSKNVTKFSLIKCLVMCLF
jgi:hypothetical protein